MDADLLPRTAVNPDHLERLNEEELLDVLTSLERLRARLWSQLIRLSTATEQLDNTHTEPKQDQLLNVNDVAALLAVTPRWVYDHSDQLPFTRKIAPRTLRFSENGLYRWLEARG